MCLVAASNASQGEQTKKSGRSSHLSFGGWTVGIVIALTRNKGSFARLSS
ncbi:hypothetical protein RB10440 [Rhodopirellula baltica SH 1]|uniref:Uncharacterized protein n=1 Tax=Rhodopirellula baltica (strain DSM 10527 / NCIMB 13988 / SH1) TaxID=243090 RepID=Q7UEZ9_RHOBA|nr:hypothetical protein RB10440 [Rhodopirellula baltica SH 1]